MEKEQAKQEEQKPVEVSEEQNEKKIVLPRLEDNDWNIEKITIVIKPKKNKQ